MVYLKHFASLFVFLCFSVGAAQAGEPPEKSLAGLRAQLMVTQGQAPDYLVRRVLSYREHEQNILMYASQRGDVDLIAKLGRILPDTQVFHSRDFNKRNAFHIAKNYNTALELLKTYAALRARETDDSSDVFDRREFKTALINAGDRRGETPIMSQIQSSRYDVAFLYLTKNADLTRKTVAGDTVLTFLVDRCTSDNAAAVDLLESFLRGDPYIVFLRNSKNQTPLEQAQKLHLRIAYEKIKEVWAQERESKARNIQLALRNFFKS